MAASCLSLAINTSVVSIASTRSSQHLTRKSSVCKIVSPSFFSAAALPASEIFDRSLSHISLPSSSSCRRIGTNSILAFNSEFYHIPYTEGIPVGSKLKLFNLPCNCDRQALIDHFSTCEAVVESLEITNNAESEENASGFVVLGSLDEACAAVAQLDGAIFQGKCVRMDFVERRPHEPNYNSRPRSRSRPLSISQESANKIYIGNLPWRVDDAGLEQLFAAHGTVQDARVMRDRESGRSRGFGFVVMSTAAEMEKAIAALDGSEVEGRLVRVNPAVVRDASRL